MINTREGRKINSIERIIKAPFNLKTIPSADKICELQLMHLITKMTEVEVDIKGIGKYMPAVMEKLEDFSKDELIQRFVSTEFNRFLNYYDKSKNNLNAEADSRGGDDFGGRDRDRGRDRDNRGKRKDFEDDGFRKKGGRDRGDNANFQRFFVNLGRKDGFNHGALLRLVCDNTGMDKNGIGKIDILNNFSFFDADKSESKNIISKLHGLDFEGKAMSIEETKKGDHPQDKGERKDEGFRRKSSGGFKDKGGFRGKSDFKSKSFGDKGKAGGRKRSYKN